MWEELPTHKENMRRKIQETLEMSEVDDSAMEVFAPNTTTTTTTTATTSSPNTSANPPPTCSSPTNSVDSQQLEGVSHDTVVFCDRFQLPITEAPLYG